ncbi:hypothetical protein TWF281_003679 [Arthrobotrys megalospora]
MAYLVRAFAYSRLLNLSAATEDCHRVRRVAKRYIHYPDIGRFTNAANYYLSWCASKAGNKADELYYQSEYNPEIFEPFIQMGTLTFYLDSDTDDSETITEREDLQLQCQPELEASTASEPTSELPPAYTSLATEGLAIASQIPEKSSLSKEPTPPLSPDSLPLSPHVYIKGRYDIFRGNNGRKSFEAEFGVPVKLIRNALGSSEDTDNYYACLEFESQSQILNALLIYMESDRTWLACLILNGRQARQTRSLT